MRKDHRYQGASSCKSRDGPTGSDVILASIVFSVRYNSREAVLKSLVLLRVLATLICRRMELL